MGSKLIASAPDRSGPITKSIVAIVMACRRFRWIVLAFATAATVVCAHYAITRFQINTTTSNFISADLPWRQDMIEIDRAFPGRADQIVVVIDGKTSELAEAAARSLSDKLQSRSDLYQSVVRPDGGPFFNQNGLLFRPLAEVQRNTQELLKARPFLSLLASDPSLRGVMDAFSLISRGVRAKAITLNDVDRPMVELADALDDVLSGRPTFVSWRTLLTGKAPGPRELRKFIEVKPVLNRAALQPGEIPSDFIRKSANDLGLTPNQGVWVRLTGAVPLADEQYGAIEEGAAINRLATALVVLFILRWALKSPRIVLAVALTVIAGLAATAAAGLKMVGAFNLISLAFGVLFVGIGTDFAIQFSVRYRAERYREPDFDKALARGASKVGRPLALAAAATAAGFYSSLPTDYVGISELGLIAGTGMFVAFVAAITVLPALLSVFGSPAELQPIGFKFLAAADQFMARHRYAVVIGTLIVALAASPLLLKLQFDFNPLDLSPPNAEAVATLRDLTKDPQTDPNSISVLASSLPEAQQVAERLVQLPEVARATTLQSFIPEDQDAKLASIHSAAAALKPMLNRSHRAAPSDSEDVEAMAHTAEALTAVAANLTGKGADDARRLARLITRLTAAPPALRETARKALLPSLDTTLDLLRGSLDAQKITFASIPPDLKRDWETPDGRARIDVAPTGDPNDNANLINFSKQVRKIAPVAAGAPVLIQEGGDTVIKSFIGAGGWALLSISVLLLIVLRRVTDMLLTVVPLVLAALVTLEIAALIGLALNFANIMALPLLLGLGVAFKIYYVMAWRAGATKLLETSLTRAVFFSALTTATAFGSLWLSKFPGLSSMGKMLALSLVCTLAAAVLFQPALMGPPRRVEPEEGR
jgi:uncharacterized protein